MLLLTGLAEFSPSLEDQSAGNPSAIDLLNQDPFCQCQCSTAMGRYRYKVPNNKVPNHKIPNHKVPNNKVPILSENIYCCI
jgi:hypothetical protein